jgi:endonuclease-8
MPEGHTIHRLARLHRRDLAGDKVAVTSPQGRFALEAGELDGKVLEGVEAVGKHLFYDWRRAPMLHVHLGLIGKFRTHRGDAWPSPSPATRLVMANDEVSVHLTGPMTCRLIRPDDRLRITSQLGPDPLADAEQAPEFVKRLRTKRAPVATALLDQKVIAGVGNVYRSEILFLAGIGPHRTAADVTEPEAAELWSLAVSQLRSGERAGRIITVVPREVGARRRSELPRDARLYVYKRGGLDCRRCGTRIERDSIGGRLAWWCPRCQAG